LTPDAIRYKAIGKMEEYRKKLNLKIPEDVLERAAMISLGFIQYEDEIARNKDRFMSSFWAGYALGRKKTDEDINDSDGGVISESE